MAKLKKLPDLRVVAAGDHPGHGGAVAQVVEQKFQHGPLHGPAADLHRVGDGLACLEESLLPGLDDPGAEGFLHGGPALPGGKDGGDAVQQKLLGGAVPDLGGKLHKAQVQPSLKIGLRLHCPAQLLQRGVEGRSGLVQNDRLLRHGADVAHKGGQETQLLLKIHPGEEGQGLG